MEHPSLHGFTIPTASLTQSKKSFGTENDHEERWYHQNLTTAKAVQALLTFPDALQNMVCQTVLTVLAQHPAANIQQSQTHTILSLYRSHKKQVPNNQRELTHSTLALVGQAPNNRREELATIIHELTIGFREYLKLCKHYQASPLVAEAHHVLALYFK